MDWTGVYDLRPTDQHYYYNAGAYLEGRGRGGRPPPQSLITQEIL